MAYLRKHHGRLLDVVKRNSNVRLVSLEELHTNPGIPDKPFVIVSCLAAGDVQNTVWGDLIPFELEAGCYKKSVLEELKQQVLDKKKRVIMIYPQRTPVSWQGIPGFSYIELPEFYGTYWDFFHYHQPLPTEECVDFTEVRKHYTCLNKRLSVPRILISHYLDSQRILHKGHVSFLGENDCREYPDRIQYQAIRDSLTISYPWMSRASTLNKDSIPYRTTGNPRTEHTILDIVDKNYEGGGWITLNEVYQTSFVDVAVESFFSAEGIPIFTEKVFKPIYHARPFMILGAPGTLTHLRELGFKTFHKWFDESYDLPGEPTDRAIKIAKEVERICALPIQQIQAILKDMKPILLHNRNRLEELSIELDRRTIEIDQWIIDDLPK